MILLLFSLLLFVNALPSPPDCAGGRKLPLSVNQITATALDSAGLRYSLADAKHHLIDDSLQNTCIDCVGCLDNFECGVM